MRKFVVRVMVTASACFWVMSASAQQPPAPRPPAMTSEELAKQPQTPGATGDQPLRHYYFSDGKAEMPYHLYVPGSYKPGVPMPLILALHGAGGGVDYFFRTTKDLPALCDKYGFIFVSPLGYNAFGGYGASGLPREEALNVTAPNPPDPRRPKWTPDEAKKATELSEQDVLNVLALVEKEYSVNTSRVYLMGHSMGGNGTWYLGQKYPERWTAMAVLSGGFGFVGYQYDRIKGIPLFIAAGSNDIAIHGEQALRDMAKLEAAGLKPKYVEIEGGTHMSMIPPTVPQVLEFFATHHR